jgi:enoyl-CoA hydratase/carnithine racemase
VADATASFGFPEIGLGIVPSSGGAHMLARLVGTARAKELVLLRERFGPDEALALGLVTETVAEGQALDRALELAERLAALPPLAVTLAKRTIDAMPGILTRGRAGARAARLWPARPDGGRARGRRRLRGEAGAALQRAVSSKPRPRLVAIKGCPKGGVAR